MKKKRKPDYIELVKEYRKRYPVDEIFKELNLLGTLVTIDQIKKGPYTLLQQEIDDIIKEEIELLEMMKEDL